MANEQEEYVLGEDVTAIVSSKATKGTMVLSVRLPVNDFSEIEALARESGKIPSQIVREAVREYLHTCRVSQPVITVSLENGVTLVTGTPTVWAKASSAVDISQRAVVLA